MKIVINKCYGGFSISKEAAEFMAKRGNKQAKAELRANKKEWYGYGCSSNGYMGYDRTDPDLVAAVEKLGDKANGNSAQLEVVNIPDNIKWEITDYAGIERVDECHRSWG